MIFDDKIDPSLYMLIESEEKNRFTIVEFIETLPPELLKKIQNKEESDETFTNEEGKTFTFEHSDKKLTITNHNTDIPYNRLYEFTLFPLEDNPNLDFSNMYCQKIASIIYNNDDTGLKEIDYFLSPNNFFGYKVIGMDGEKKYISSRVNLKGIIEEQERINKVYGKKRELKK